MLKGKTGLAIVATATMALLLAPAGICVPETTDKPAPSRSADMPRVLTLDGLNKFIKADQALAKVQPRDLNMEMGLAVNGTPDSFQGWLARLESSPEAVAAIQSAGMSPRDYLQTYIAVVQASAVSSANKQSKEIPARLKDQVPAANVSFIEAHGKEISRIGKPPTASVKPNTMEDIYVASDPPKEGTAATATAQTQGTTSSGATSDDTAKGTKKKR